MMKKSSEAETMSKVKQFAFNFKPTFQASTLFSLCNFPSEKTEINFVLNYWPFSKYKPNKKAKSYLTKPSATELRNEDKQLIKSELQNRFSSGSIQFDDESLMGKVSENLARSSSGFQPEWDEDSNETKFEKRRQENAVDINNNETESNISSFNVQEQIYQDKRNYELEKYKSAVKINISIERGNQLETHIIEKINKEESMNFVQEKSLKTMDFGHFRLCGIIDGIDSEKKTLIEVKTRNFIDVHKRTINLKDKLQCLAYLKLTGCERCLLVESGPKGQQNKFFIDWDESEFEDRIIDRLRNFVVKYRNMKESEFRVRLRRYKF